MAGLAGGMQQLAGAAADVEDAVGGHQEGQEEVEVAPVEGEGVVEVGEGGVGEDGVEHCGFRGWELRGVIVCGRELERGDDQMEGREGFVLCGPSNHVFWEGQNHLLPHPLTQRPLAHRWRQISVRGRQLAGFAIHEPETRLRRGMCHGLRIVDEYPSQSRVPDDNHAASSVTEDARQLRHRFR